MNWGRSKRTNIWDEETGYYWSFGGRVCTCKLGGNGEGCGGACESIAKSEKRLAGCVVFTRRNPFTVVGGLAKGER